SPEVSWLSSRYLFRASGRWRFSHRTRHRDFFVLVLRFRTAPPDPPGDLAVDHDRNAADEGREPCDIGHRQEGRTPLVDRLFQSTCGLAEFHCRAGLADGHIERGGEGAVER